MKTRQRHRLLFGTAFVILVAGVAYACKDFLVGEPQGTLDEQTLTTKNGVERTLIGAYRVLDWSNDVGGAWGSAASNWVWGSVPSDDAYKGSDANDQAPINDVELYQWGVAGGYINDKWRSTYEGVVRSNATLRLLKKVLQEKPGEISASDAAGIKGEALFLRAHYHFEAWRMWGNIPYYYEDDTDFRKTNVGVNAVANILRDLDTASALLLVTPRNGQVGRATQWTARAYKGRVQVHSGDFAGGLATLQNVRASGRYALELNFHRVWTGFQQYENGPETILAYQASANDGEPNGNNANYGERLNFPHSQSPFGCCGFHQPSQNLVNFFVVDGTTGLPLALTDPTWNARDVNFAAPSAVPVDPRLDWTVGRDGVPYKDWGPHAPTWNRDRSYGGPYSPKKNIHERASGAQSNVGWNNQQLNSVNIHIYRYADLLLLLAEAEVEAGVLENARTIVNEIRTRAGVAAQGPGTSASDIAVPINDLSITWAVYRVGQYTTPWTDQTLARRYVRYERRLELAMEGQRFFDLRRWGDADTVLNNYIAVEKNRRPYKAATATYATRHRYYPIPPIQIQLSRVGGQNRLVQNPEW
jgi:starch-binding outer membrane protein, SusD/RagB family